MFKKIILSVISLFIILPNIGCIAQKRRVKNINSVFQIFAAGDSAFSTGTTFAVAKSSNGKTLFVTNYHVCTAGGGNESIVILDGIGSKATPFDGKVVKTDISKDLCLIESDLSAPVVKIKDGCSQSEVVTIIGNPNGIFPIILDMYVSIEKIDKEMIPFSELDPDSHIVMVSGKLISGHSGSPVIAKDKKVCGIIFAASSGYGGYAMSGKEITNFISSYSGL